MVQIEDNALEEVVDGDTRVVHAELLDDGEKVRHSEVRLARIVMECWANNASRRFASVLSSQ